MKNIKKFVVNKAIIGVKITIITLIALFGVIYVQAAFTEPAYSPTTGNVPAPINVGSVGQTKAGPLTVNGPLRVNNTVTATKLDGTNEVCIGGACKTAWPPASVATPFTTQCQINTRTIELPSRPSEDGSTCYDQLTDAAKDAGWYVTGWDRCPSVRDRDCSGTPYCTYQQLQCDSGVSYRQGSYSVNTFPVAGFVESSSSGSVGCPLCGMGTM